jgi:hypothetical protein
VTRGAWRATSCAAQGQRARVRICAHASGHVSQARQEWLQGHPRPAQQAGGGRMMGCRLPRQRPWLNPMEPTWVQGKRAVVDPACVLSRTALMPWVCAY